MAFFKLAGTAHGRAADAVIAHAGRKAGRARTARAAAPRAASRMPAPVLAEAEDGPDEAHFARF
jgi:hypothetical protein